MAAGGGDLQATPEPGWPRTSAGRAEVVPVSRDGTSGSGGSSPRARVARSVRAPSAATSRSRRAWPRPRRGGDGDPATAAAAASSVIASTPGSPRIEPSRASSPASHQSASGRSGICSEAQRIAAAIARSNPGPALRRSAGARLAVIRLSGKSNPQLTIAARTRSRDSRTAASGSPTRRRPAARDGCRSRRRRGPRRRHAGRGFGSGRASTMTVGRDGIRVGRNVRYRIGIAPISEPTSPVFDPERSGSKPARNAHHVRAASRHLARWGEDGEDDPGAASDRTGRRGHRLRAAGASRCRHRGPNSRTRAGEIDVVALDRGTLVFVEVKAMRTGARSGPERPAWRSDRASSCRCAASPAPGSPRTARPATTRSAST